MDLSTAWGHTLTTHCMLPLPLSLKILSFVCYWMLFKQNVFVVSRWLTLSQTLGRKLYGEKPCVAGFCIVNVTLEATLLLFFFWGGGKTIPCWLETTNFSINMKENIFGLFFMERSTVWQNQYDAGHLRADSILWGGLDDFPSKKLTFTEEAT